MGISDVAGILLFGGGMWFGHWSHRRFGLRGTAIALVASGAVLFGVHWFKGFTGSDERIMSEEGDSLAYKMETPDHSFPPSAPGETPAGFNSSSTKTETPRLCKSGFLESNLISCDAFGAIKSKPGANRCATTAAGPDGQSLPPFEAPCP